MVDLLNGASPFHLVTVNLGNDINQKDLTESGSFVSLWYRRYLVISVSRRYVVELIIENSRFSNL